VQTGPASRLEYIDGLRALAALWVAAHHVIETSVPAASSGAWFCRGLAVLWAISSHGILDAERSLSVLSVCSKESRTTGIFGLGYFRTTAMDSNRAAVLVGRRLLPAFHRISGPANRQVGRC
jgi:hypothetical protein